MSTELTTPTFPAVVFSVTDAAISALEAKHKGLVIAHGNKKGYLALTQAIAEVRTARVEVDFCRVTGGTGSGFMKNTSWRQQQLKSVGGE